jgi:general L-amino acid transport system substrate-binding protein
VSFVICFPKQKISSKEKKIMRKLFPVFSLVILASLILAACVTPAATPTAEAVSGPQGYGTILARVKERGKLVCGVHNELLGFGYLDENGRNVGFDIDLCRAVAAAVLGDAEAIEPVTITAADRGPVLVDDDICSL